MSVLTGCNGVFGWMGDVRVKVSSLYWFVWHRAAFCRGGLSRDMGARDNESKGNIIAWNHDVPVK